MRSVAAALLLVGFLSAATAADGEVWRWGTYIGGGVALTEKTPVRVEGTSEAVEVDASNASGYARTASGKVLAWGDGKQGELGDGEKEPSTEKAVQVQFQPGVDIVSIGEARDSGAAVDSEGNGWVWGNEIDGSLCDGKSGTFLTPRKVITGVVAVQGGQNHTLWLGSNGHVYACGTNEQGQLGVGEEVSSTSKPMEVKGPDGGALEDVVEVSAGVLTSGARTAKGEVLMWGGNTYGQVGVGTMQNVFTPEPVKFPPNSPPARQISVGGDLTTNGSSLAVLEDGEVYGWGDNHGGQAAPKDKDSTILSPENTGLTFSHAITAGTASAGLDERRVSTWGTGDALGREDGGRGPAVVAVEGVEAISGTAGTMVALTGEEALADDRL
jgi:alpha-tubulin suppressor-like RCC1 family protein